MKKSRFQLGSPPGPDLGPSRPPFWEPFGPRDGRNLPWKSSWSGQEPIKSTFFRSQSRPRGLQEDSKTAPRGLQELKRLQDRSKTPPGTDFNPSGTLRDLKIMIFRDPKVAIFCSLEQSARHPRAFQDVLRQACCVKSSPRYSKTSRPGPLS